MQKIFELVRKEDVVLWIGSGFSKYAGYPLGSELNDLLLSSLSSLEKKEIQSNLQLSDLAEEFVRIRGNRDSLNKILLDSFLKPPTSLEWHKLIFNIPQIKTIITTNYDNCFELVYNTEAIKLVKELDIVNTGSKREIFKVHGDLEDLNSIIITKTDYENFFSDNRQSNIFWNTIIERIASKTVIFIGYNFEDSNIKNIFKKISAALKDSQKERFLIAPNFKKHKVNHLRELGIKYVDLTGEVFIDKLYKNVISNILQDFKKKYSSPNTLDKILANKGLKAIVESSGSGFKINSIQSLNGNVNGLLSLKFKDDKIIAEKFSDFIYGKKSSEFVVHSESLLDFKLSANEINLIDENINNFKLIFNFHPSFEKVLDIECANGNLYSDIKCQGYFSKSTIEIVLFYKNFKLTFTVEKQLKNNMNIKLSYEQISNFQKTSDALSVYTFLNDLSKGETFTIYLKDNINKTYDFVFQADAAFREKIKSQIYYFELMKKIENIYKVRFQDIDSATDDFYEIMELALSINENRVNKINNWNGDVSLSFVKVSSNMNIIQKLDEGEDVPLLIEQKISKEFEVHGQSLLIKGRKRVEFRELKIISLSDFLEDNETVSEIKFIAGVKEESYFSELPISNK